MRAKQRKRGWVILATAWLVSGLVVSPCRSFCSQKPSQIHGLGPLHAAPNKESADEVDALTLPQRQLQLAVDQQATAQAQVNSAQAQVDMAVEDLRTAKATGDEQKVKEAEVKVKEAKQEVKDAEGKVETAEAKVKEAKEEMKAQQVPGFQSLTELLGGLLFPDAVPLKDRKATYTSASSYIVNLDSGPFNGRLALQNNRSQARLLDRELEVDLIVQELLKRSNDLKGQTASDKSFSPAFLVAQAPGAGKSHFLALLGEQIPILYDLDGKKETPIVSAFTYNSKMTVDIDNLKADLALRVLYGATRHMSRTTCEWRDFLKTWKSREIDSIDVDLAVEILRAWYGDRPVVILADELGKSKDEALVRQELCRTMDTWGGQVFVVMSSLTNYKAVVEMFERSQRRLYIFTLGVLGTQANDLLFQTLRQLPQNRRIRKGILEYRISLAWGATGGYARAIELLSEYIRKQPGGLEAGVVGQATTHLSSCNVLPSRFSTKELETVLEMWEQEDCPFQTLNDITEKMPAATYKGSVLVDSLTKKGMQVRYLPTVAPWHAARLFTSKPPSFGRKKRCAKLMGLAGSAYLQKVQAIESPESNEAAMRQTSSYFTEVVAAFAVMFAIVKKYKKLPQVLRESESACDSICSIGFNVSLSQKKELATQSPADADEKLVSFLKKAMDLSKQLGKQESLLVIMAPPNCKAVDFLIFCQKNNRFVAAQVKSNKVTEATAQNAQKTALLKAAKDIRSASNSQPVAFLAIVGSNYTETEDLKADTDFFCLQQEDLVALIPPFLRQLSGLAAGVQGVEGVRSRKWQKFTSQFGAYDPG